MTAANRKFQQLQRKVHAIKTRDIEKDDNMEPAKISTEECICKHCGFKARYKFHRCPECGKEQK